MKCSLTGLMKHEMKSLTDQGTTNDVRFSPFTAKDLKRSIGPTGFCVVFPKDVGRPRPVARYASHRIPFGLGLGCFFMFQDMQWPVWTLALCIVHPPVQWTEVMQYDGRIPCSHGGSPGIRCGEGCGRRILRRTSGS